MMLGQFTIIKGQIIHLGSSQPSSEMLAFFCSNAKASSFSFFSFSLSFIFFCFFSFSYSFFFILFSKWTAISLLKDSSSELSRNSTSMSLLLRFSVCSFLS